MTSDFPSTRRRQRRAILCALLGFGMLAALVPGCGKKGPPLAPLVRLPGPVDAFSARRLGSTVYLQFTVPIKNQDNSTPADVARVEVYGYTGTPASDEDMVKYGTLVAEVPVRRPPPPEEEERARGEERKQKGEAEPAPQPKREPVEREPGFDQGATVTVTETVTPALLEPVVVARRSREKKKTTVEAPPILPPPASLVPIPTRVYVAVGVNRKGQRGSFSPHAAVSTLDAPAPPADVKLSQTETAITIEWTPPPGAPVVTPPPGAPVVTPPPGAAVATPPRGAPVGTPPPGAPAVAPQAAGTTVEIPPLPATPLVSQGGPVWSYEVYEIAQAAPVPLPAAAATPPPMPLVTPPVPLNPQPLTATSFTDPRIAFGTERCYAVRAMTTVGALREESEASDIACITPRDIYPPAAPTGLTAVVNAGAVSLIWNPNAEPDLDGYLVLRAETPSGTLQPVTRELIRQTTFNDTTVTPGVRYVYAIVAVDKAGNPSAQSNRIEETAR